MIQITGMIGQISPFVLLNGTGYGVGARKINKLNIIVIQFLDIGRNDFSS